MPVQRIFHPLHDRKHLLLFQSSSNDLHSYGQTSHLFRIIVLVCALRDAVEVLEVKGRW
jgi:hypothetical protein